MGDSRLLVASGDSCLNTQAPGCRQHWIFAIVDHSPPCFLRFRREWDSAIVDRDPRVWHYAPRRLLDGCVNATATIIDWCARLQRRHGGRFLEHNGRFTDRRLCGPDCRHCDRRRMRWTDCRRCCSDHRFGDSSRSFGSEPTSGLHLRSFGSEPPFRCCRLLSQRCAALYQSLLLLLSPIFPSILHQLIPLLQHRSQVHGAFALLPTSIADANCRWVDFTDGRCRCP